MKKKDKVEITFIGGMAEEVTGSCTMIKFKGKTVLVDMGMSQGGHTVYNNYVSNRDFLRQIKPKEIDAVIITHSHADHLGLIPCLFSGGTCDAKIFVAKHSKGIMREMLIDSASIMERDALLLTQQKSKPFEPFYNEKDVNVCLDHMIEVEPLTSVEVVEGITLTFYPNAHILLSQQAELVFDTIPVKKRVVFTGDLGNLINIKDKFYMDDFHPIEKTDYLISESTYGASSKRNAEKDYAKDLEKMKSVISQFTSIGSVLIPTFSLDRTPYFMWLVYNLFKDDEEFKVPVLIDSPLAIRLLKVYENILEGDKLDKWHEMLNWKNFKFVTEPEESQYWVSSEQHKLVLSASGMMQQGRSVRYLKALLPGANNCILCAGYMGENTLGYKIKESKDNETVMIQGKPYKNRCNIVDLKCFSGHMQHNDLVNYLSSIKVSNKILLVHGEMNGKMELKKELENKLHDEYKTTKVVAVNRSTKLTFD